MVGTGIKVLIADIVLVAAEFLVLADQQARLACAVGQPLYGNFCLARSNPGSSYSILTQYFSMISGSMTLQGPPSLDWLQLLVLILVAVNLWYGLNVIKRRRLVQKKPATFGSQF